MYEDSHLESDYEDRFYVPDEAYWEHEMRDDPPDDEEDFEED